MANFIEHVLSYWRKPAHPTVSESRHQQRAEALQRFREDFSGYDPFDFFMDRYYSNGEWWFPIGSTPGIGGTANKVQGQFTYVFRTEQELRLQRDRARLLYATEPIAQSILGHLRAFVIGKGMTYTIQPKKLFKDSVDDAAIQLFQDELDAWLDRELWFERELELFECGEVDGEWFLRIEEAGELEISRLEPEHITNPPGGSVANGWYFGAQFDVRNAEVPIGYYYRAYPHNEGELLNSKQVMHFKENVSRNVARGVSSFYCLADDLDGTGKLIDNNRDGAASRARIAYIRSHKNTVPDAVGNFAAAMADTTGRKPNGSTAYGRSNRGSVEVDAGENMDVKTMPSGDVEGNIAAVQMMYRVLGNRFCGMPEFMVSGDASNNNFASIKETGGPFIRQVEMKQMRYKYRFKKLMERVLLHATRRKGLPKELLNKLEVNVGCQSPVMINKLEQAQTFDIEARNGALSPQEWCANIGRDFDKIQAERDEYADHNLEAMVAQNDALGVEPKPANNTQQVGETFEENTLDDTGHMHKGKGPGGGQFTGKGSGDGKFADKGGSASNSGMEITVSHSTGYNGKYDSKGYVAEITDIGGDYELERKFDNGEETEKHAGFTAKRKGKGKWETRHMLKSGKVYEVDNEGSRTLFVVLPNDDGTLKKVSIDKDDLKAAMKAMDNRDIDKLMSNYAELRKTNKDATLVDAANHTPAPTAAEIDEDKAFDAYMDWKFSGLPAGTPSSRKDWEALGMPGYKK